MDLLPDLEESSESQVTAFVAQAQGFREKLRLKFTFPFNDPGGAGAISVGGGVRAPAVTQQSTSRVCINVLLIPLASGKKVQS